ncbi:MAG: hypothetical protein QOD77_1210 [Thermoplasmata archaeon]|jgi:ketosteroid isomerase-like protein|nr:hypothetical protein [Thermoplasmata archaeon]
MAPIRFDQHPNALLVHHLYDALARRDGDAMAACYTPDAAFSDPVFPDLHGAEVGAMWRMLTARGGSITVEVREVVASATDGTATWEARYLFGATGRKVRNVGNAVFTFRDGRIATHVDTWSFSAWAAQALGLRGRLLGKTAFLRRKVRRQARRGLEKLLPG